MCYSPICRISEALDLTSGLPSLPISNASLSGPCCALVLDLIAGRSIYRIQAANGQNALNRKFAESWVRESRVSAPPESFFALTRAGIQTHARALHSASPLRLFQIASQRNREFHEASSSIFHFIRRTPSVSSKIYRQITHCFAICLAKSPTLLLDSTD